MKTTTTKMSSLRPGKKFGMIFNNRTLIGVYQGRKNGQMEVLFGENKTRQVKIEDIQLEAVPTWAILSDAKFAEPKKVSKVYLVDEIVRIGSALNKSRKEMINQIMTEVGMSKVGASTYYYNSKKKLA